MTKETSEVTILGVWSKKNKSAVPFEFQGHTESVIYINNSKQQRATAENEASPPSAQKSPVE